MLCKDIVAKGKKATIAETIKDPNQNAYTFLRLLAYAMQTKKPKQNKNQSIDYSKAKNIGNYGHRFKIRDSFLKFIRELWLMLEPPEPLRFPNGSNSIISQILRFHPMELQREQAMAIAVTEMSEAVYRIVFCNWLSCDPDILHDNFRYSIVEIKKRSQTEEDYNFYDALIKGRGKGRDYVIK